MADAASVEPADIVLPAHGIGLDFHPGRDVVAVSTVTGTVLLYTYAPSTTNLALDLPIHRDSCRVCRFSPDGNALFTAGADRSISVVDASGKQVWREEGAHSEAVNALHVVDSNYVVSGDDSGEVRIWDTRKKGHVLAFKEHDDFVSSLIMSADSATLLSGGGDGRLAAYSMKKGKMEAVSDEQEDELLSLAILKQGKKVVAGTQGGVLTIWSWGYWGDLDDRFPGHPHSVDAMIRVDDDTVLTGSSDGIIRVVSILPNRLLGVVGEHGDFPIERLAFSCDREIVASLSHDERVRFWASGFLFRDDDDDEEEEEEGGGKPAGDSGSGPGRARSGAAAGAASGRADFFSDIS